MNWPEIKLITSRIELADLTQAALDEEHETTYPTHMVKNGGLIVGWHHLPLVAAGPVCVTLHWFSKKHLSPRECFEQVNWCENWCRNLGYLMVLPMVGNGSGFEGTIEGMGYSAMSGWKPYAKAL